MTTISGYGSIDFADAVAVARKLNCCLRVNDLKEIRKLYEALCKSSMVLALPCAEDVQQLSGTRNIHLCCSLYREIFYRHLFATSSPTLTQRINSWLNYCHIFKALSSVWYIQFPYEWLWDLVDEFVNQFKSFGEYRALEHKTKKDIALLKLHHEAWSVHHVLHRLNRLIEDSSIIESLNQAKDGGLQLLAAPPEDAVYDDGFPPRSKVPMVLGYFSMVGLLRVHCLLGNYQTGLNCFLPIDIRQKGFYTTLIATRITTIYHYGFANLMSGRYAEAIPEINNTLVHIFKSTQPQQNEQILSKIEKMYALLAICLSLCPSQPLIDENVKSQLMEKYGEKMSRMQRYDDDAVALYQELLSYAWPAFSTVFVPSSGNPRDVYNKEELALYDDELWSIGYPEFFGPDASGYGESYVNHNQKLEAVIARMLLIARMLKLDLGL